jgi:hypothetical protein
MKKNRSGETIRKIVELEDEIQLKRKIIEIESKWLEEEMGLIMKAAGTTADQAYNLLMRYRGIWEFTSNVSVSGDSLIITLPKKEAIERGITKGTPLLVALKALRFFEPEISRKMI